MRRQMKVRPATSGDLPGILKIYNEAVLNTTASYDYEPRTLEHRAAWFEDHVKGDQRGRGIGRLLMQPLLEAARQRGLHAILAGIDAENEASIRLHTAFGFVKVAHFKQVGFKFGRWLDVIYMELLL